MTKISKKRGPWLTASVNDKGVPLVACVTPFGVELRPLRSRDSGTLVTWERIALMSAQIEAAANNTRKTHTVQRGSF